MAANETTPLAGDAEGGKDGIRRQVTISDHACSARTGAVDLGRKAYDAHSEAFGLGMRCITGEYVHGDDGPTEEQTGINLSAFRSTYSVMLVPYAAMFATIGSCSMYISHTNPTGSGCAFDLSKFLFMQGCSAMTMAMIFLLTTALPPVIILFGPATVCFCASQVVLFILTLASYATAAQCGATLWWVSLIMSNAVLAGVMYCCCNPIALAKTGTFLTYKAASAALVKPPVCEVVGAISAKAIV